MELLSIDNFRFVDRNKAGADIYLNHEDRKIHAEFYFYLQGNQCLGIRLGRHDKEVPTALLEKYITENIFALRKMVLPDIARIRQERVERMSQAGQ